MPEHVRSNNLDGQAMGLPRLIYGAGREENCILICQIHILCEICSHSCDLSLRKIVLAFSDTPCITHKN